MGRLLAELEAAVVRKPGRAGVVEEILLNVPPRQGVRMRAVVVAAGLCLVLPGCVAGGGPSTALPMRVATAPQETRCTTELRPAIAAVVRVEAPGEVRGSAWLVVRGRGYADSASLYVRINEDGQQMLFAETAHERRGTFEVTVRVPGHHTWRRSVRVRPGTCHVEGVTLEVHPRRR
jgi:hypothetical protein